MGFFPILIIMIWIFSLILVSLIGCSPQPSEYLSPSFTSPEGTEITKDNCTADMVLHNRLGIDYSRLRADRKNLKTAHTLGGDIGDPDVIKRINRLVNDLDRLTGEYNQLVKEQGRSGGVGYGRFIEIRRRSTEIIKQILKLEKDPAYISSYGSVTEADRLWAEYNRLSAEFLKMRVESYSFTVKLCDLLSKGYQLTEKDKAQSAEVQRLIRESNKLVDEENRLLGILQGEEKLPLNERLTHLNELIEMKRKRVEFYIQRRKIEDTFIKAAGGV